MAKDSYGIDRTSAYKTPDGRIFEKYDEALWWVQREIQKKNLLEFLEPRGVRPDSNTLDHVLDYIMKEHCND